ncbi:MAG: VCBS repeat-containing protein [Pyrinomonadaceae bacterium]
MFRQVSKYRGKIYWIFIGILFLAVCSIPANAANFTVTNTNDNGAGSLRDAIAQSNSNGQADFISFDPSVFSTPRTITLTSGEMMIGNDGQNPGFPITIEGPGENLLTIDANAGNRIFYINTSAWAEISGMTLTGGNGTGGTNPGQDGRGGGIFSVSAYLVSLKSLTVTGNSANLGGGINISDARTLFIRDSHFTNNSVSGPSARAGGIYSVATGIGLFIDIANTTISDNTTTQDVAGAELSAPTVEISGSTISGNNYVGMVDATGSGVVGGLRLASANGVMTNSVVSGNNAHSSGGGIEVTTSGKLLIKSTTVANNIARSIVGGTGCGINRNAGGTGIVTIMGSTISGNQCIDTAVKSPGVQEVHYGAGISSVSTGKMYIINSTITGNQTHNGSNGQGGGGGIANCSPMQIINSTIVGNFAGGLGVTSPSPGIHGGGGVITRSSGACQNPPNGTIIQNTIISNNDAAFGLDVSGNFTSNGHNLVKDTLFSSGFPGSGDILGTDPLLEPAGLQDNGGPTLTIAPTQASIIIHNGNNALAVDQDGHRLRFDQRGACFYRYVINTVDIGAYEFGAAPRSGKDAQFDFDGDCFADLSIFRPGPGEWWYLRSSDGGNNAFQFGSGTDTPVPADYTGDGIADIAFWRPSTGEWFILRSEDSSFFSFPFGAAGDTPAPGDYDGDGKADPTVFRSTAGLWFINRSSDGNSDIVPFGTGGDRPVPADYDGDGRTDVAIFRPANGQWWLNRSTVGVIVQNFGTDSDRTVQGDYTGDGRADVAFWRPSTGEWFILRSEDFSFFSFPFGAVGDVPAAGDYDADGRVDAAVFRPAESTWYINGSSSGVQIIGFGQNGDVPLPSVYSNP